jgi:hypothetical protein
VNTLLSESTTDVVNTLLSGSTPDVVNTLLTESRPDIVNTLLTESRPDIVTTLLSESTTDVVNTLLSESTTDVVNTLLSGSTPDVVNTLLSESTPDIVNTLLSESTPDVVNTLLSESTPDVVNSIKYISTFKLPCLKKNTSNSIELTPTNNIIVIEPTPDIKEPDADNQDMKQKLSVACTLLLELYRMLTSSLLILFIPQSCGGELCTISDNLIWNPKQHLYNTGIFLNFLTLFTFSCLYYVELKRENRLIKYLDVNPKLANSNEAVEKTLDNIAPNKKNKILFIDKQYQIISFISIGMFVLNSFISGIVVNRYYLGSQTTTTLITSLLFMLSKLFNVYTITNTEKNIFFSAYMTTRIQFNDLDETHKIII